MKRLSAILLSAIAVAAMSAQSTVDYAATVMGQTSTGDFAPYFIGSLNGGRTARKSSGLLDLEASIDFDLSKRFSWGAGVEILTGYQSGARYDRWNSDQQSWSTVVNKPSAIWVQQLYGEVKFRGVFLRVGQKSQSSELLDESLSSGDLVRSCNARPIPGAEIGFVDFQDIPFTNGWVQIQGMIEYGRMTDDGFTHDQFNYFNSVLTSDLWYTYKRCYFRTNPFQPFSVTLGMQAAGNFAGSTRKYAQGVMYSQEDRGFRIKDVFRMFFPIQGDTSDGYYEGSSLGSWDFKARYRFNNGHELAFAFEWPWEDGSGIGRRNGWDGLWGLYYNAPKRGFVDGVAIEYLDFTNQSGPIHWAPGDFPGSSNTAEATGGDDYYNNEAYGAYANYGMSIGTPFIISPLYNTTGYPMMAHNRARGIHVAVAGSIGLEVRYKVKYSWQEAWGTGRIPASYAKVSNCMMIQASWNAARVLDGLSIDGRLALDTGSLRGNNFGVLVGVTYSGDFSLKK